VQALLKGQRTLVEKKMSEGLASMWQGKMFAGILNDNLAVRVGPDGVKAAAQLRKWLTRGADVRLESTGGKMNGLPPTRLTSFGQHV
jgi:hypothetical protein